MKHLLRILLIAMVAVVFGLVGCDSSAEETGPEPTTDTVISEDSTVPPVSETTTDTPSCLKADGPGCVEEDVIDPPVEVVEPMGCETLPFLIARPDAKKVECIGPWGSGICDLITQEEGGTCYVGCAPEFYGFTPDQFVTSDTSGFSFKIDDQLITCTLL